jgi:sugar lactone lactonase YvrE
LILLIGVAGNPERELPASPDAATAAVVATDEVRDPGVLAARAALQARPNDPEAHYALAEAEAQAGFPLLAARDYRKAADLFLRARAGLRASEAYLKAIVYLGGPEKAEEALVDNTLKAVFTAGGDDPQGTLTLLEEAAKVLPDWPPLLSLGAHAQIAAGELDPARKLIETALALDPRNGLALAVQAELLRTVGDRAGARQAAEAAQATGTIPAWLMAVLSESLGRPPAPDLITIGGEGKGPGLFTDARSMGMDEAGRIYVAEYDGGRVQVFDKQGVFQTQWFADRDAPLRAIAVRRDGAVYTGQDGAIVLRDGQSGEALSRLTYLQGSIFNDVTLLPDGSLLTAWYRNRDDVAVLQPGGETTSAIKAVVSQQTGEPELSLRVASDGQSGLWVLGEFSNAVFHFDGEGRFINRFGSAGDEPGQLSSPQSIAMDGKGRIYVGDFSGVQVFAEDGRLIGRVEVEGPCYGLFIDPGGRLWVANGTYVRQYEVALP